MEAAASVLDLMTTQGVKVEIYHLTCAIRACWCFGKTQHRAAKYFIDLFPGLGLKPNLVALTALIGAYSTAPLEDVVSTYDGMRALKILPDTIFAETYLATVFHKGPDVELPRTPRDLADVLREQPSDRRQAAPHALKDFRAAGIKLTRLSENMDKALRLLEE